MNNEQFTEQERAYIHGDCYNTAGSTYLSERTDCYFPAYLIDLKVNNLPVGKYNLNLFHDNELAYQNACQLKALNIHAKADNTTLKFIIDQANTSFTLVIKDAFSRNIISELRSQELLNRRLQQNQGLNV